ncbi:MAG: ribonuclease R [Ruminococcus sp.]|nr:ribonuclease R [Ruminococcus sp.]
MKKEYEKLILSKLKKSSVPVGFNELYKLVKPHLSKKELDKALDGLEEKQRIVQTLGGYSYTSRSKLVPCKVSRIKKTFGFVRSETDDQEYFVAGRNLKGALPGDSVLVQTYAGKDDKIEARVFKITEESFSRFTGNVVNEFGELKIVPDTLSKCAMRIENADGFDLREGDKILAEVTHRGENHSEHICTCIMSFGSSLKASVCALSVLELNGLTPMFPNEVIAEAKEVSDERSIAREISENNRLDLRTLPIFTIDGAQTKDIDDAISVEKTTDGYKLGVHIADVSHYVKPYSLLDEEAFKRGTSVYYANRVIPMLPTELSNGICSLNPNEDRLAFSALMKLDKSGNITDYKFAKTIIRSRVKGVYSEINELLEGYNSKALCEKYAEVLDVLSVMSELAQILFGNRIHRGAPQLSTTESELLINDEDYCVDVRPHQSGTSQEIIEDFMLCANECAARFGKENGLPFVYRVHEDPPAEKLEYLKTGLTELNIPYSFDKGINPKRLSEILEWERGTDRFPIVNNLVLRSMAKARYADEPLGHFGLVLKDYAHFTSPIRRYSDLAIHRIMTDFLSTSSKEQCEKKYGKFAASASDQASKTELVAMQTERSCEDCYKAEYMKSKIGKIYEGIIISCTPFGMYVMLENTCEGLVRLDSLPYPDYYFDEKFSIKRAGGGPQFTVGKRILINVASADVSSGNVDFEYCDETAAHTH